MSDEFDFKKLEALGNFEMKPFEGELDDSFKKLELSSSEMIHLSGFLSHMPELMMLSEVPKLYRVDFPAGFSPENLVRNGMGGYYSPLIGEGGKIAGHASFYSVQASAALLNVFTVMSIATSQYFLAQINSELKMLNMKFDKILSFLYGDKKAELISEVKFVSNAYKNYGSIMRHEQQREATLIGLQGARKVAMKDIEFYIQDLNSSVNSDFGNENDLIALVNNCIQIHDSLNLSLQLYFMCSVLECHYALNNDKEYINNIEEDLISYNDKCRDRILNCMGTLAGRINSFIPAFPFIGGFDKEKVKAKVEEITNEIHNNEAAVDRNKIKEMIKLSNTKCQYILDTKGNVYCKPVD